MIASDLGAILAFGALTIAAQDTPPSSAAAPATEEVVVTGRRLERAAADYVREVASPTSRGLLARWRTPICPAVIGFPETYGRFVADRVAQEADRVGVRSEAPGCRPNILILVTPEARKAAASLSESYGDLFADRPARRELSIGPSDQTRRAFVQTDRPVRWWHVSGLVSADGRPVEFCQMPGRDPTVVVPCLATAGSSRLSTHWGEGLSLVLIVVDGTRLNGASYEQLASYLAMVSLAQLAPDPEPSGLPSILSVFEDRAEGAPGEESLTTYDRAYLKALYDAPEGALLRTQRSGLRKALARAGAERR